MGSDVSGKSWSLLFESGAAGHLKIYFNGVPCGEFDGIIGSFDCSVDNVRPGANTLEIFAENIEFDKKHGWWAVQGDIYLLSAAKVKLASSSVKCSWREATILGSSEVENHSASASKIKLDQYCVLDGKVKYRLPSQEAELAPGGKSSFAAKGIWTEAVPWGIGGVYGDPLLYDFVADLYVDGKLADRLATPFGFREFWIAGSDFYLNGRRIVLHGDVGFGAGAFSLHNKKACEVVFPLLRADGINIIRNHDSTIWSEEFLRSCDRMGMLAYVQMHPVIDITPDKPLEASGDFKSTPYEDWLKHPVHQYNLHNFERWTAMLRSHPSVVIASTDNEIFTQAWDNAARLDYNLRNDKVGAFYGKYVKSLEPSLIITRDGDEGTWGRKGKWHEEPPCDTANYHYPDFNINEFVINWQSVYEFRPAVFGETLYYSYGAWDKWIGAIPSQVHKKAMRVREVASLYRRLGIPAQIFMGPISDGFVLFDESGKGNPWGITASQHNACLNGDASIDSLPGYPWAHIPWPSMGGGGLRFPANGINVKRSGAYAFNWFDPNLPSHVRNEVNDAYHDSLPPQPPLGAPNDAECLVKLGPSGKHKVVKGTALDSLGGSFEGTADSSGNAWLQFPRPGKYRIECGSVSKTIEIPGRASYAAKPGFASVPNIEIEIK